MTQHTQSLQSLQQLTQQVLELGLLTVQLARDLEQRLLSLKEHSPTDCRCEQSGAPDTPQNTSNQASAKTEAVSTQAGKMARVQKRDVSRDAVPAQCRACGRDVLRLPDSAALFDDDGTPHATTCARRRIVCRDAVCFPPNDTAPNRVLEVVPQTGAGAR